MSNFGKAKPAYKRILQIAFVVALVLTVFMLAQPAAAAAASDDSGSVGKVITLMGTCPHTTINPGAESQIGVSCCLCKSYVYVVHRDASTLGVLRSDCYLLCCGYYGPYYASYFSGYGTGYLAPGSSPVCGYIGTCKTVTITYLYPKLPVTAYIIVEHRDQDTRALLLSNSYTVNAGYYGPYGPQSFPGYRAGVLIPGSADPSGTIAAGQTKTISYMYAKLPVTAYITVTHKDSVSGVVLRSDSYTVNAGNYGPYYPQSFQGYGAGYLATGSAPASGSIAAGASITVTFLYDKLVVNASVKVVHRDLNTGEILRSDTHSVAPGYYGPYNALTFPGYGAGTLAADSAPAYGTVTAGQSITVTYNYVKLPQTSTINVVHREPATGLIIRADTYTVNAGAYGPYNPMSFSGYGTGTLAADSAPASGVVAAGQIITITYNYTKTQIPSSITVNHKDIDTGIMIRTDTYTVYAGSYGPYYAMSFGGYGAGTLASGSAPASGTIGSGQSITISYVYAKLPTTATINVQHKDQESGATLRSDTFVVNAGPYGPYGAWSFAGYGSGTLASGSAPASGTIAAGQTITITYNYIRNITTSTINVVHKDPDTGATIRSDTYTVNAGSYGPYYPWSFSGYGTGVLAPGSAPASGTIAAGQTITITYYYTKLPTTATINVVHKDPDTGATLRSDIYTVNAGSYGPYNPMSFTGYGTGTLAPGSAPASGTISAGQSIIITYNYKKLPTTATITVVHKDPETGAILRSDTYTVNAGAYGPYNPMSFTGYGTGTLAPGSAPASGTISAGASITITYNYARIITTATIYVVHKDPDTGATLRTDIYTVNAGAYGPYNPISFSGYGTGTLASGSAPASGTIAAGATITITYNYKRLPTTGTIVVTHRDQVTLITLQVETLTVNAGSYGPINPKTIPGYDPGTLAPGSAPASGTITAGQTINIIYQYKQTPTTASITVLHRDGTSKATLKTNTYTVSPGAYGPYKDEEFTGYGKGTLATGSAPASGTILGGQSISIIYEYYSVIPSIAVLHMTETEEMIQGTIYNVNEGAYGPYGNGNFSGFSYSGLDKASAPTTGTIKNGEFKIIKHRYRKN